MEALRNNTEITHGKDGSSNVISAVVFYPAFPEHLYRIQVTVDPEKIDFYDEEGEHVHLQVRRRDMRSYPRSKKFDEVWPTELRTTYCKREGIWEEGYQVIRKDLVGTWEYVQKQRELRYKRQMRETRAANIANELYLEMKYQGATEMQTPKGEENEDTDDE